MLHCNTAWTWILCLFLTLASWIAPEHRLIGQERDYDLKIARQCANWLTSVSVVDSGKRYWPTVPYAGKATSNILYSGNPGVVLFFIELHLATGEQKYLRTAIQGGDWLREHAMDFDAKPEPAFFTGVAGIGFVFDQLHGACKLPRFKTSGKQCYDYLTSSREEVDSSDRKSVRWNDVTDIIGGTAGIGFYLLESRRFENRSEALKLATMAGDNLISKAKLVELPQDSTGMKWMMSPDFPREMPNYSHGTAGICDFLLALDQACRSSENTADKYDGRFLKAAIRGASYLETLATKSSLIPHHFPDGDQLFYFGWCHGPPGTVGFLERLERRTQDKRWGKVAQGMVRFMFQSGIPKVRPDGFWNNAGLCCGNAGVASFLLDRNSKAQEKQAFQLTDELTRDIMQRATRETLPNGEVGLYWTHAEHRAQPKLLQAQTGLMQGTAGIGMYFVRRHQMSVGRQLASNLPMMPY